MKKNLHGTQKISNIAGIAFWIILFILLINYTKIYINTFFPGFETFTLANKLLTIGLVEIPLSFLLFLLMSVFVSYPKYLKEVYSDLEREIARPDWQRGDFFRNQLRGFLFFTVLGYIILFFILI